MDSGYDGGSHPEVPVDYQKIPEKKRRAVEQIIRWVMYLLAADDE